MFLDAGRPAEAERVLRRFLSRRPGHGEALLARARSLARLGRGREAAAEFSRAIEHLRSAGADVYLERADALLDAGASAAALRGLDEGLAVLGPLTVLQSKAVDIETELRRYDAALQRLEALTRQSPLRERWLLRRGEILELAGRPDQAREAYREAVSTIESRPAHRRGTPVTKKLEQQLRSRLGRLTAERESGS